MPRVVDGRATRFGGFLEDFEVGDIFHHWPGMTITEAADHQFCLLTRAVSPIHVDAHFAANEMDGGKNIVVGTYIFSLLLGMSVPDISGRAIANLGVDRLRHIAPVFHGDTIYGTTEILAVRLSKSRSEAGILTVKTLGVNQSHETVCDFTRSVLLPRRPESELHMSGIGESPSG